MKNIIANKYLIVLAIFLIIMLISLALPNLVDAAGLSIPQNNPDWNCNSDASCISTNPIVQWISFLINVVSVLIIVGATVMIAYAGVEYIIGRDNASAVQAAKTRIFNVVSALVGYFFLYAFVQWLIPGGAF